MDACDSRHNQVACKLYHIYFYWQKILIVCCLAFILPLLTASPVTGNSFLILRKQLSFSS